MGEERNINRVKAEALEKLFQDHYSSLCFFAFNFLKDEQAAEDVAQEAFESLFSNFENVAGNIIAQRSYLYSAVRNKCLNVIRHEKVKNQAQESDLLSNPSFWEDDHQAALIKAEVYKEIYDAIACLPKQCRKIYEMTYYQKLSEKEIAEALSISIHSVKSQKQRGKQLLKEHLKDLFAFLICI